MGLIGNMFAKMAGKAVAGKLELTEGTQMNETKKWYQSKNVWTGVVTFLIGAYSLAQTSIAPAFNFNLPAIPEWIFAFLGAMGIYTRIVADKKIG